MLKHLIVLAAVAAATAPACALGTGGLAFTSFNADEDGFSVVTFVDIAAGTKVFFTDNEFVGGAFNTGESYASWTSGAAQVGAGTVIRFSQVDVATLSASVGTLAREPVSGSTNWGLSTAADSVYAYLRNSATAPTTFLAAITNSSFNTTDGALAGTGLVEGATAMRLRTTGSPDYGVYSGVRSGLGSFAGYKPLDANVANWTVDTTDGNYTTAVPDTTAFSITAVPEPGSYALMLAGLAGALPMLPAAAPEACCSCAWPAGLEDVHPVPPASRPARCKP